MKTCMQLIESQYDKTYYQKLIQEVEQLYQQQEVYPSYINLYSAFKQCSIDDLKVVILGQDPYHEPNQANGLAFSVPKNVKIPPSLRNIYQELYSDLGIQKQDGDLYGWAKQGVLLFNTCFTVQAHQANSHRYLEWDRLSDAILQQLNDLNQPLVFILWGKHARSKKYLLNNSNHLVLESAHPSPLSAYRGFFGSQPFSKANDFLIANHIDPIDWSK